MFSRQAVAVLSRDHIRVMMPPWQCVKSCIQLTAEDLADGCRRWSGEGGSHGGEGEARQLPSSELKRKIKHEIMEVTVENIMKYINLGKAVQWAIKYEIRQRGRAYCSRIDHECIKQRRR